ncbi:MAG: ATP-binding protein [Oceanicoccus sp.]
MPENLSQNFTPTLTDQLPAFGYRCSANKFRGIREVVGDTKRIVGYSHQEIIDIGGTDSRASVHPEDRYTVWTAIQEDLSQGDVYDLEYRVERKTGGFITIRDHGEGVYTDGKLVELVGIITPISQRNIRERNQKEAQKTIVQLACSTRLARGEVEAFCREVTFAAAKVLNIDRSSVWLLNTNMDELRQICLYEKDGDKFSSNEVLYASEYPAYFKALISGRAIDAIDAEKDYRTMEFCSSYFPATGVRSMLDSAIRVSGKVIGAVCNEKVGEIQHWYTEDISFSGELGDQLSHAIANRNHIQSENQAQAAKVASETKSQLLATISHELRTPMNGVLGTVDLLSMTQLDLQQQKHIETIRNSGDLLLTLINDVLDYSKLEAGKLELLPQATHVSGLFHSVIDLLQPLVSKDVKIKLNACRDFPETLSLDDNRIRQLLFNIIGNSIKYTSIGSICVKYGLLPDRRWMIEISDTGTGIDKDILPGIFYPFSQSVNTPKNYHTEGAGLGLSICRTLVELMEGKIVAESEKGQGTTIRIELPLVDAMGIVDYKKNTLAVNSPKFEGMRVLVAEDNAVNRKIVVAMLKQLGIVADLVTNGEEAVEQFQRKNGAYDLLLLDCEMPVMDGFTASKAIRALQKNSDNLTIAALSAHALDTYRDRAKSAMMDVYLTKPIRTAELTELLLSIS